mgnify:CR=1 FL=1
MQKVQLADRLGNVQVKKVGFSWVHLFLGPLYCFGNLKIFLGLLEALIIYYFCPIPGMDAIASFFGGLIKTIPGDANTLNSISEILKEVLLLFRSSLVLEICGIVITVCIHLSLSFKVRPKVLKRTLKRKELRPVEEKDARILIKWGVVDDKVGLAESFDIRGTTKYKSAEENWYENNQIRIKSRPSFSTRSNIRYTVEQKAQIQSEQLDNLYKLGLVNKEEYHSKKIALKKAKEKEKDR